MKELIGLFNQIAPLTVEIEDYLKKILKPRTVKRKEIILREGEVNRHIYFIEKGLVRGYHNFEGEEVNSWFQKEGDIFISVHSFFNQKPSFEYIEAMEDCIIWGISFDELEYAYSNFIEFNIHGRKILQKYYPLAEERNIIMRRASMSSRYEYFIEKYPDLLRRVPDKYLATHLGMTVTTFSHIKSKYQSKQKRKQA